MLARLREIAATVGRFDRSAFEPGYALRCTIGVAIPLAVAAAVHQPGMGVAAAIGAFITGFTSLQGVYRTRLWAILAAGGGMALTAFVGSLAAHSTIGLVAATLIAGYLCGAIGQLGPSAATVTLNSLVAFILFSSQPLSAPAAALQSVLILGGGLVQAALLMIAAPFERLGNERIALADVYAKLADYARSAEHGSPDLPPITPLATARQILADPQPLASAGERARLNRLFEDALEIRSQLAAFASAGGVPAPVSSRLDDVAHILSGRAAVNEDNVSDIPEAPELTRSLRDATMAARVLAGTGLPRGTLLSQPRPGPYVSTHVTWLTREALRFAVVLGVAMVLGRHFAADRGYWIPLTAALVLKPDFQTTFVRGFARIAGTVIGAVIATLVLTALRGNEALEMGGILVAAGAAYLTFYPNYAVFTVAITSFVVLVLHLRGLPGTTTIEVRLFDTLGGGALAMLGYLVMPTWEHRRTRALLAELIHAQCDHAAALLNAFADPSPTSKAKIAKTRNATWKARTAAEASVDRSLHEPNRRHTISPNRALRILAATQRFGLASLALETALDAPLDDAFRIAAGEFAKALRDRLTELERALRDARRVSDDDTLLEAYEKIEGTLSAASAPQDRFVAERLRTFVDATSGIARLIGSAQKPAGGD